MSDDPNAAEADDEEPPKKKSKAILFGLIGAVLLGGGAFYGVYSGMIPLPFGSEPEMAEGEGKGEAQDHAAEHDVDADEYAERPEAGPTAFVPLDEMIISLGPNATAKHLKVRVSIEVDPEAQESVVAVVPRVMDVLNTYLRAVDEREFEVPHSMMRVRAQMLRRVQLVTPRDSVRDVLVQEFVLN